MSGYRGIGPEAGHYVREEDAYTHALMLCLYGPEEIKQEFRKALVEWFYSGNWIYEEVVEDAG